MTRTRHSATTPFHCQSPPEIHIGLCTLCGNVRECELFAGFTIVYTLWECIGGWVIWWVGDMAGDLVGGGFGEMVIWWVNDLEGE